MTILVVVLSLLSLAEAVAIFIQNEEIKELRKRTFKTVVIDGGSHRDIDTCHFCGKESNELTVSKDGFVCCNYCLFVILGQTKSNVTA